MEWEVYNKLDLPLITEYDDSYDKTSWEELEALCANGNPVALYEKARRLHIGEEIEQDLAQAMWCYKEVLKQQKHTKAMYHLGTILCEDEDNDESIDCVKLFRLGSELGDADCSYELGTLYNHGEYVKENTEKSISYYLLAHKQGDKYGLGAAGSVCLDIEDYKRAYQFFSEASQNGDTLATFFLGKMYWLGQGVEENDDIAFQYLKSAADAGEKDAHVILGAMYGFGKGTEKNIQLAMSYLDDVLEDDMAKAYNYKGRIFLSQGQTAEGKKWLEKAAGLGDEDAQHLLDSGAGKTDEERANEGSDPYAMLRYSAYCLGNEDGKEPDFIKAKEIIYKANQLYPDNLDVKEQYIRMLFMDGHILLKIGAKEDGYNTLQKCISEISLLRSMGRETEDMNSNEMAAYMESGEAAFRLEDKTAALTCLSKTDHEKYPYAAALLLLIHLESPEKYANEITKEVQLLRGAVNSSNWGEPSELAIAYGILAEIYAQGVGSLIKADVDYAYNCLQKCSAIDPELAEKEMKKYSKNIFGKITYKG